MKKRSIIIFLIGLMILLTSCNIDETNIKDRVGTPNNNKPPIEGKWIIKELANKTNNLRKKEDSYIGSEALFHKDALIVGSNYVTKPSYKIKTVDTIDYLLYKYKTRPEDLGIKKDKLQVITVLNDNQYFNEFVKYNDDTMFVYLDNSFYKMERTVKEVSCEEVDRYISIEKAMIRDFETVKAEKLQTGVLLGVKIPTYDEKNNLANWEYETIWINSKDKNITSMYKLNDILLPRKNGFWVIDVDREVDGNILNDKIKAVPQFSLLKPKGSRGKSEDLIYKKREDDSKNSLPSTLRNILFVSNNYISIEDIDIMNNEKRSLKIYAIDNLEKKISIKLSDFIEEDGSKIFLEGLQSAISMDVDPIIDESNIGLFRRNGYWIFKGRVNYKESEEELYKNFNIKAIPPKEMVSYDKHLIPWDAIKRKVPEAIDMFSSPNDDLVVVVTHTDLLIYSIENKEEISSTPMEKIKLPKNASIIMAEWAIDRYPDMWESEVIEKGGEIIQK
ncbi:hypothetical protein [Wansuia hejianensis]|uniref:Lipoprotein n=1 Tax=Wansuia hejianensis TaxID=2763667 RepID=A0A926EV99_9FIRM|nr:hypothetical protein [Wansuia hejianensis]MBC8589556.1 hypothetical protein [Wansuia hejianensis]